MANGFTFGGKSTRDFENMKVEKFPGTKGQVRKMETISVLGRNGDLHIDLGAYENTTQSYECYYSSNRPTNEEAHAIRSWLLGTAGYQRLEDGYDPAYYRRAMVKGGVDIVNKLNKYGRFTVTFDCDPRYFLKSGEEAITLTEASTTIYNFTDCPAQPLITVYGSGAGYVKINGISVIIKDFTEHIVLDCEAMNAYHIHNWPDNLENKNGSISAEVFPVLDPGNNIVQFAGGGITHIEIVPRWCTL